MITFKEFLAEEHEKRDDLNAAVKDLVNALAHEFKLEILIPRKYVYLLQNKVYKFRVRVDDEITIYAALAIDADRFISDDFDEDSLNPEEVITRLKYLMNKYEIKPPSLDKLIDADTHPELAAKMKARKEKHEKKMS